MISLILQVHVAPMLDDQSVVEAEAAGNVHLVWTVPSGRGVGGERSPDQGAAMSRTAPLVLECASPSGTLCRRLQDSRAPVP